MGTGKRLADFKLLFPTDWTDSCGRPVGAEPVLSLRTVHVGISRGAATTSANVWPATIRRRVFQGDFTQYQVDWDGRQLVVRCATGEPMGEGEPVYLSVEPRHCVLLEN